MSVKFFSIYGRSRVTSVCALVLWAISLSAAQEPGKVDGNKCSISGTVTDQTLAVIASAQIVLTNAAGEKVETQSDEKGHYSFAQLKPGTYKLTIAAPNFSIKTFDDLTVPAGLELNL